MPHCSICPSVGGRADIERGRAGLDPELYRSMLAEVGEQARLADDLGYDSISFTEHHFHVEGFELSNNPVLLDLFVAMQTRRLRVGQLGIVLPANNPIRVAEDIAMLDQMSGGRANAGFARGYQRRWVDVMAQQTHGIHGALPHQHDAIDAANREAFEECFRIIKRAWTEDFIDYQGRYWRVPPGETPWELEATKSWGGGVEDGILRQVAVVPKPVQKPHPPIFQPFASSERSVRWCAAEGVTAILPPLHPRLEQRLFEVYAETSGRPLGDGVGVLRDLVIAPTDERGLPAVAIERRVLRRRLVRAVRLRARHDRPRERRAGRPLPRRPRAGGEPFDGVPPARGAARAPAGALDLLLDVQRLGAAPGAARHHRALLGRGSAQRGMIADYFRGKESHGCAAIEGAGEQSLAGTDGTDRDPIARRRGRRDAERNRRRLHGRARRRRSGSPTGAVGRCVRQRDGRGFERRAAGGENRVGLER